jgi:hypothetical protein
MSNEDGDGASQDEVIRQDPGVTYYRAGDLGPAVPYVSAARDISHNYGFANLREKPELIPTIPEVQNSPGLKAMVAAANDLDGALMSIGCERVLWEQPTRGFSHNIHSYLEVTFYDGAINATEGQLMALAEAVIRRVVFDGAAYQVTFEMGLERLRKFFGDTGPHYCLNIGLTGFGRSPEEAEAAYEVAAAATAKAILEAGVLDWPQELAR